MTWQPIETAPKDGTFFLACKGGVMVVMRWDWGQFRMSPGGLSWNPTHWMPLPEPPKEAERADPN